MTTAWRIYLKKDIPSSPDYGEYCLKNKIAGMGWILDAHNAAIRSGKIEVNGFSDFANFAAAEGVEVNQVRLLAEEIKPGDFVWTYVGGKYYLAKVFGESRYAYDAGDEATFYRACNRLTNIDWKLVGVRKDVDERIAKRFGRGQTLRRIFANKNPNAAFGLKYSEEVYARILKNSVN